MEASTAGQEADAISVEASARVLQAFAAAWVAAGHQESELIHLVVKTAVRVPAQSRLPLLSALSTPHSSVSSLPKLMLIICQMPRHTPQMFALLLGCRLELHLGMKMSFTVAWDGRWLPCKASARLCLSLRCSTAKAVGRRLQTRRISGSQQLPPSVARCG